MSATDKKQAAQNMRRERVSNIMVTAGKTVLGERGAQHGNMEDSFTTIANFWTEYLVSTASRREVGSAEELLVTPFDVAQMMVLLKVARSIHGNPANVDHYVDAAGYSAIAGSFGITETPTFSQPHGNPPPTPKGVVRVDGEKVV